MSEKTLAELKRQSNKARILEAFDNYTVKKLPGSETAFYSEVLAFAKRKMYDLETDSGFRNIGTSSTVDDYAQEIAIDVFTELPRWLKQGKDAAGFYSWLNSIVFNTKRDFKRYLIKEKKTRVPLEVPIGEDSYTGETDPDADRENPAIYRERAVYKPEHNFNLNVPASVQGVELDAVQFILAGYSQKETAKLIGITESALNKRLERLRKRMAIERTAEKAKIAAERDARGNPAARKITFPVKVDAGTKAAA